jgi:hypothetical protein
VFAFDPSLSRQIDTKHINEVVVRIPWDDKLEPGPVDDYLEIIDYDPSSASFYGPVDLNLQTLLAQDGHDPSEGNPQFHQQMVYAVARATISHFEHALGRAVLWSPRRGAGEPGAESEFVQRLRIYPHALRQANAFYSPSKKALLFGYFPAEANGKVPHLPGEMIFSCLSHDIVAHEMTHALLDGIHPRFIEPSNVDVLAFHEALADIVALFQHFTHANVLRDQIAKTRGDLEQQNMLGELAFQFGQAIGFYGSLRSALGRMDPDTGKWKPDEKPDPNRIRTVTEPHERGAILVAAVFDAFLAIYKLRIRDILRLATNGTGVLPEGDISVDLVERLAEEAAKTATHMLRICIRALDYCPPVDITFGDYLRALVTADFELVADDPFHYRLAIIEAFRQRGIFPRNVRTMSEEALLWNGPDDDDQTHFKRALKGPGELRNLILDWGVTSNRREVNSKARSARGKFHRLITSPSAERAVELCHLCLRKTKTAFFVDREGVPSLEVHSVRPARRVTPHGETKTEIVVEMTQRRHGYYDEEVQRKADRGSKRPPPADFLFRGGCTLLIDPDTAEVRYCIYKRILNEERLRSMRRYLVGDESTSLRNTYFGDARRAFFDHTQLKSGFAQSGLRLEPFAILHRLDDLKEGF